MLIIPGCGGGGGGRGGAASTCAAHSSRMCYVNNVYWSDSCGNREELSQTCADGETCSGGACVELWEETFGGSGVERAAAAAPTADGGLVVAGYTQSYGAGSSDFWVVKTDSSGNKVWDKTFGGTGRDEAKAIQQTADGGYIVAGYTQSYGAGDSDFWVVKLDASGAEEWNKTFGGANTDEANSVAQTADGGYIVAGHTRSYGEGYSDYWVLKLDASGGKTWEKTFGGADNEVAESVLQTAGGGYIVAGRAESYATSYGFFYIIKLDASGGVTWEKIYGGDLYDGAYSISRTADGGYVAAGYTYSFGAGMDDVWVLKIDASGNEEWSGPFGGYGSETAFSIVQTADGGYILAGESNTYGAGSTDAWVVKLTSAGGFEWSRPFGGANSDWANTVRQTTDGGYVLAGSTYSSGAGAYDFWLMKIGADGLSESCPYACCDNDYCGGAAPYCVDAGAAAARCAECRGNSDCRTGTCSQNFCSLCESRKYKDCSNGDVYWFDSCGMAQERFQACSSSETCSSGACAPAEAAGAGFFGGTGYDIAQSIRLTSDEGYIVTGLTTSFGAEKTDVYVVKVDRKGAMDWENHFGGAGNESGASAVEAADGGFVVAGQTDSSGAGGVDVWALKLDSDGEEVWNKTFGGTNADAARSVMRASDGGFAVAGYTYSSGAGGADFYLLKLDASGGLEWSKTYGGPYSDTAESARATADGGFVMAGYTYSYGAGSSDAWVVKADASGGMEWAKTFGGAGYDRAGAVRQTSGGGYIVAGHTYSSGRGDSDVWVLKLDASGGLEWEKTFGGEDDDAAYDVSQTPDGNFVIVGYGISDNRAMTYLLMLDAAGELMWEKLLSDEWTWLVSVEATEDGGFAAAGDGYNPARGMDARVIKYDEDGNVEW